MEQGSPSLHVTLHPRSWIPVALVVLLVLSVEARLFWLRYRWWALSGIGMMLVVGAGWWVWGRRTIGLSGEERVVLCYARLRGMAPRLGVPLRPCDTPAEFAAAVEWGLAHRRPHVAWLETAMRRDVELALDEIFLLTRVYERVSYAPTLPDPDLMRRAWREGHHLHQRLWRLWALSTASD